jgi:hypothetical protein
VIDNGAIVSLETDVTMVVATRAFASASEATPLLTVSGDGGSEFLIMRWR